MDTQTLSFFLQTATVAPARLNLIERASDCIVNGTFNIMVPNLERVRAEDPEFKSYAALRYKELKLRAAARQGIYWGDVFAQSDDLRTLQHALFLDRELDDGSLSYRSDIKERITKMDCPGDLLYIESVELVSTALGLAALKTVMQHSACRLVVMALPIAEVEVTARRVAALESLGFCPVRTAPFMLARV